VSALFTAGFGGGGGAGGFGEVSVTSAVWYSFSAAFTAAELADLSTGTNLGALTSSKLRFSVEWLAGLMLGRSAATEV
jgi:hypothetical protein